MFNVTSGQIVHLVHSLSEEGLSIHTKQDEERNRQKHLPPKLKGKHFSNLEYLADAALVCLTPHPSKPFPGKLYDECLDTSYIEQCFFILHKLGEGSYGSVLKVMRIDENKFYALKVSKEPFRSDWNRTSKIREVKYHKKCSHHTNVVTLYEAWEEDRHLYMQLELCKSNLLMVPGKMTSRECWEVITDITSALDYMHDLGIGHFDIKLENILRGYDGLYKLSDFGLVYDFIKGNEDLQREGDAKYLAPEVLPPNPKFTSKADIYSLGISVLELAGNLSLPSNGRVWKALREDTFPISHVEHLSRELFCLIVHMMAKDPDRRPTAKEILGMHIVKRFAEQRGAYIGKVVLPLPEQKLLLQCKATWELLGSLTLLIAKNIELNRTKALEGFESDNGTPFGSLVDTNMAGTSSIGSVAESTNHSGGHSTSSSFCLYKSGKQSCNSSTAQSWKGTNCHGINSMFLLNDEIKRLKRQGSPIFRMPDVVNSPETSSGQSAGDGPQQSCSSISLMDQRYFRFPASTAPFGVSPIHLSNEFKKKVKEIKRRRMTPRNLTSSFDEEKET